MNGYLATGGHWRASKQQASSAWCWKRRGRGKTSNNFHPLPFSQEERGVWPRPLGLGIAMLLLNLAAMSRGCRPGRPGQASPGQGRHPRRGLRVAASGRRHAGGGVGAARSGPGTRPGRRCQGRRGGAQAVGALRRAGLAGRDRDGQRLGHSSGRLGGRSVAGGGCDRRRSARPARCRGAAGVVAVPGRGGGRPGQGRPGRPDPRRRWRLGPTRSAPTRRWPRTPAGFGRWRECRRWPAVTTGATTITAPTEIRSPRIRCCPRRLSDCNGGRNPGPKAVMRGPTCMSPPPGAFSRQPRTMRMMSSPAAA